MTHTTTQRHRWVSPEQAADYLGVNVKTIRRLIATGQITGRRLGKRLIRVDLDELDATMQLIPTAKVAN
jgi:excisionase family DNA binding protein